MTVDKRLGILIILLLGAVLPVFGQCTLTVTLTASNNGIICSGNSVTLTATAASGTGTYNYTWSTGDTTPTISVNRGGTYTVSVDDQTPGCQPVTQSITVTEMPVPNAPIAAGQTVCINTPATLTATSPGGTYSWYDAPTGGNLLYTGDTFLTPPITQQTAYFVETTLGGCSSARTFVLVSLSSNPSVQGGSACAGNTVTLSAGGADSYTWYDAPNGNQVGTGPSFTTPPLTTSTNYYVVGITNGCASAPVAVLANITPYPQAPTAVSPTICTGSTVNLHADGNGMIDWFDVPSGGISLITSPDYTTPVLTAAKTYYVQATLNGCPSLRTAVTITVNAIPDPPTTQPQTICFGTSATLTANSATGGTFNWYADAGGTTLLATGNTYTTPALTANTTYYVQTLNGGCVSGLAPLQVTVTPTPPAPVVAGASICTGTSTTLTATAPGGVYTWYDAPAGGTALFSGNAFTTPVLTANTTYYVQTALNGCTSPRTAVTVTIFAPPAPPTANDASTCSGSSATLTASGGVTYAWYNAPTGGSLLFSGKTYVTPALTANKTYYVETTNGGGCVSTRTTVNVTVNAVPAAPTASGVSNVCPNTTATVTAVVPAGGTAVWFDAANGGSQLYVGNTFTTPALFQTTTYYVATRVGDCVSPRTAVTVSVVVINSPQFQYTSGTYCTSSPNPIPVITDPTGGIFTATPVGLKFVNNTTGEIDIANSLPQTYKITFTGNEACHVATKTPLTVVILPNAKFSYSGGPFCQYAPTNPSPVFPTGASAGNFTASPAGLVFVDNTTGQIDLKRSIPGTYTVTNTIPAATDNSCPETHFSTTVTVAPGARVNAGPDQIVNAGAVVQLAGSIIGVPGGKWSGGAGNFSDPTQQNATYTPAPSETTATLTLTSDPPAGSCGVRTDVMVITIVFKPAAPTAPGAAVCTGSAVTLKATAPGGTYRWYDAPTGGNLLATGASFTTPAITVNTTYYVQTTVSGNTSDRTAVNVTVNAIPVPPTVAAASTCPGSAATLTAQGVAGTYNWYDVPAGGTTLHTGATFTTPVLNAAKTYYVDVTTNGCPSLRTQVDVAMKTAPAITSAASSTICSGDALAYTITTDDPTAVISWARPQVPGISNAAVASHTASQITETLVNTTTSPINVTYNISAASGGNCTTMFPYVVTVNPLGAITSLPTTQVCFDSPLNYTVTFGNSATISKWSRDVTPGISNAAVSGQEATNILEILHNTTNAPINVNYVFTYTEGNCARPFTMVATVNPFIGVTSAANDRVCSGSVYNYNITSNVSPVTFNWSRAAIGGISNAAASQNNTSSINETLINTTVAPITVQYLITPVAFGCQGPQFPLSVIVYPLPPVPVPASSSPVCVNSVIVLQSTQVLPGVKYQWTGPNGFASTSDNPVVTIPNATAVNAGTYTLTLIQNDCAGPSATTDVEIHVPAAVDAGTDQTVCKMMAPIKLAGKVSGGTTTGIWSSTTGGEFRPSVGDLDAEYIPTQQDLDNGSVTLKLTSTSKDDCTPATDEVTFTFGPTPAVNAGPDQDVCVQNTANALFGSNIKPGPVHWTSSGTGTFTPQANTVNASYAPSQEDIKNGAVTLTLHYDNATICDIPSDDMVMHFIQPPGVDAGGTRYVLRGHTITLRPTVNDNNLTYLWAPAIGLDDPTKRNPVLTGTTDRFYTLTVTDARGCTSQSTVFIKVQPDIVVANTFTPNGDGINDHWDITGLIAYTEATVDVFNRNGTRIFHSVGYPVPWDGSFNGVPVPVGTYYYVIHLNLDSKVISGPLTVLR